MFDNLVLGPLCIVCEQYSEKFHIQELLKSNFIPICEIHKGDDLFKQVVEANPELNVEKLIISIGYKNVYE